MDILANLERFKIKDSASTTAAKNYINGAELISPQMKTIIDKRN
jgi:molecular chaperone GrpE (heat shock protein)